jgi:hypothetical protein
MTTGCLWLAFAHSLACLGVYPSRVSFACILRVYPSRVSFACILRVYPSRVSLVHILGVYPSSFRQEGYI